MKEFQITEEEFLIDGKPELLLCGEIHYFRMEKKYWEAALEKLAEAGCNAVAYYVPWFVHEYQEGKFDFTGEVHPDNDLHTWISLTQKKGFLGFLRPGPYVYAETTDLGIPKWFTEKYTNTQVQKWEQGAYKNFSAVKCAGHNHPDFLKAVDRWYTRVASEIRQYLFPKGNLVMVQLCNEIPCDDYDDRNPENLGIGREDGLYPSYLKQKYGTKERLEETYGHKMPALAETEPHMLEEADPARAFRERQEFYYTWYYPNYFQKLREIMEREGVRTQFVHNAYNPRAISLHYQNRRKNPWLFIGVDCYYSLTGNLDKRSGVYFAEYGAEYSRSFLKNVPWVIEQESGYWNDYPKVYGPELYLWNIWTIAGGYRGFNLYLFASGINRPGMGFYGTDHNWQAPVGTDGTKRETYDGIARSIRDIRKYEKALTAPKQYDLALGVKNDPGLIWTACAKPSNDMYFVLRNAGYNPKIIDFCEASPEELSSCPVLVIVTDGQMEHRVQEKLAGYVRGGGTLILNGCIPWEDRQGPCSILADALKISGEPYTFTKKDQEKILLDRVEYFIGRKIQKISDTGAATVLAWTGENRPAVLETSLGKGKAIILPFVLEPMFESLSVMLAKVLTAAGAGPQVQGARMLHVIPKAAGESIILNPHPVRVCEELRISGRILSLSMEPYSFTVK